MQARPAIIRGVLRNLAATRFLSLFLLLLCAALLFPACGRQEESAEPTATEDPVTSERRLKDAAFKNGPDSPLPEPDRAGFRGLAYYPIDASLSFRADLNRHPVPRKVRIGTNTGEIRDGLRYGWFEFEIQGAAYCLQAYRMEGNSGNKGPSLFIPFKDATSGTETYAAGRYLDLPENTSGVYTLDFNRAYNPYCAYGKNYSCPVPPPENTLPIAIRAGERDYRASSREIPRK
jgi:hypothetical protein